MKPNCAYIIPPNRDMAFINGALQLLEQAQPQDQRERAICIVLSGTGSDGTLGIRTVKGEGGMVMAQNPESTEYDGMPRSAIATGLCCRRPRCRITSSPTWPMLSAKSL